MLETPKSKKQTLVLETPKILNTETTVDALVSRNIRVDLVSHRSDEVSRQEKITVPQQSVEVHQNKEIPVSHRSAEVRHEEKITAPKQSVEVCHAEKIKEKLTVPAHSAEEKFTVPQQSVEVCHAEKIKEKLTVPTHSAEDAALTKDPGGEDTMQQPTMIIQHAEMIQRRPNSGPWSRKYGART